MKDESNVSAFKKIFTYHFLFNALIILPQELVPIFLKAVVLSVRA